MSRRRVLNRREEYLRSLEETPEESRASLQFFSQLKYFYKRKWGVTFVPPTVNGAEVDLYKLYHAVKSFGGWQRVTNSEKWAEVAREAMDMSDETLGADYCARLTYMRFLSKYEQCEQQGDTDDHDSEMMGSRNRVRGYSLYVTSECPITTHKKEIPDSVPQYDRLMKSLISGLPNEIDFSLNACALMSAPGPLALRIDCQSNLINMIVAQAGVFDENSSYMQNQFEKLQKRLDRDFEHFWSSVGIDDVDVIKMFPIRSNKYSKSERNQFPSIQHVGHKEKSLQVVRQRILQVSDIIRNLSFETYNQSFLATNWACVKFLLASMASNDYQLRNNALDTISELSPYITFTTEIVTRIFLRLLRSFVFSNDRFLVMRSTEILGRLCMNTENEPPLSEFFDSVVMHRLFELMSAKDVLIAVNTLDTLYNMSESGREFCEKIAEAPHSIELLFDFCTIEASQFFTEGLSGIKVIEFQQTGQEHHISQSIRPPIRHSAPFSPQLHQRVLPPPQSMGPPAVIPRPHVVMSTKGDIVTNKPTLAAQLARPVLHQTLAAKSSIVAPMLNGTTSVVSNHVVFQQNNNSTSSEASSSATEKTNGVETASTALVPNGNHQNETTVKSEESNNVVEEPKPSINGTTQNGEKPDEINGDHADETEKIPNGTPKRSKAKGKKRAAVEETPEPNDTPVKKTKTIPKKKVKNGHIESKETESVKATESPSSTSTTSTPTTSTASAVCIRLPNFMCEWNACTQFFHSAQAMIYHILNDHIDGNESKSSPTKTNDETTIQPKYPPGALIYCLWPGCERTPRSKWSLVTHLQDHHCNENALNTATRKRREVGESNYVARLKQTLHHETPAANHAGYSNYAAYEAIRRHAFQHMTRDLTEDHPEGPVTKDLRLTSALILRNLARHSAECRRRLRPHEGFMAYMAMSVLENGTALAQCLAALSTVELS
ncbi:hypothetical protein M3Y94_01180300 [Aphelenchoides besseyi]|nr:hypothetical protein M3Y94_01180300 [Aphelenchoides besseyi]KAI6228234.1 hypothetical protein M3Y95_00601200 [Aphelenchoides besseyi]